jgi:transcriptional regulator with XRE-family HTH domain
VSTLKLRLAELRQAADLSQEQLARRVGVRQATISQLETGKSGRIELELLEKLARALDVEPGEFFVRAARKGTRK